VPEDVVLVRVNGRDLEYLATAQSDRALIRRLATAAWIEAGPIEGYGGLSDRDDTRVGFEAAIVFQIETCGCPRLHCLREH
jgi:hypothetical protein